MLLRLDRDTNVQEILFKIRSWCGGQHEASRYWGFVWVQMWLCHYTEYLLLHLLKAMSVLSHCWGGRKHKDHQAKIRIWDYEVRLLNCIWELMLSSVYRTVLSPAGHLMSCAHTFCDSLAPMTRQEIKRNPEETLKCIFFLVLRWKEGRDGGGDGDGQKLSYLRALKLEALPSAAVRLPWKPRVDLNMSLQGFRVGGCFQSSHCVLLCW